MYPPGEELWSRAENLLVVAPEKSHLQNVATTQAALDLIANTLVIPEPALARFARALKEAKDADGVRRDLWPLGKVGGGKGAAQVYGQHLAHLILAMFAQQPAEAVEVVDEIWGWAKGPRVGADGRPQPDIERGYATLGQFLWLQIEALARESEAVRTAWFHGMNDRDLRLCVDREEGLAFVMDGLTHRFHPDTEIFYRPGKYPFDAEGNRVSDNRSKVARTVSVPLALTMVAADLLHHTLVRQGSFDFTSSDTTQPTAEPRNENAVDPARSTARTRTTDRLRGNGTGPLPTREGKVEIAKSQASPASRSRSAFNAQALKPGSASRYGLRPDFGLDPADRAAGRPAAVR